jgi:putative endonuclease
MTRKFNFVSLIAMEYGGTVYIMTNKHHTVLYTGVTSNLRNRVGEHKIKKFSASFASKYNCNKIVYYCFYSRIEEAIAVKQIKDRSRAYKEKLINDMNSEWKDLWGKLKNGKGQFSSLCGKKSLHPVA